MQDLDIAQIVIEDKVARQLEPTAFICRSCWQRTDRTHQRLIRKAEQQADQDRDPSEVPNPRPISLILPGLLRAPNTANINGPYVATTSDADIMNDMLNNTDSAFQWFYMIGDVFILDCVFCGFRDSARNLESSGYVQHMPETKYPKDTQLTTDQANKSRLITICLWVVEMVNVRFKVRGSKTQNKINMAKIDQKSIYLTKRCSK
ncbi:hypothetical protein KGM_215539 [Danaus plexippus plexippus]|uniref:Uncharacterized protein n=1 Tax=Danaus plexippus plexippus TaxID=278856 RepID=A0A212FPG9_DANPL|nr:hypothetical protein KGM_215539 [Danaus plexippus plexippus]